jgi:hypothetical protein
MFCEVYVHTLSNLFFTCFLLLCSLEGSAYLSKVLADVSCLHDVYCNHRYRSAKIDCLSFVYVPATSAAQNMLLFFFFFAAAVYSTNEENTRS